MSTEKQSAEQTASLSHFQMLIWTGQHLQPDSPMYNTAFQIGIPSSIDGSRFEAAFREVVRHSQSLRTVIKMINGVPHQCVVERLECEVPIIDLSGNENPQAVADQWCAARCQRQFALDRLLFDTALLKLNDDSFAWYYCQHHITCDAWSVTQLFQRVAEGYTRGPADKDWQASLPLDEIAATETRSSAKADRPRTEPISFYGTSPARIDASSLRTTLLKPSDPRSDLILELASRPEARSFSREMSLFQIILVLLYSYLFRASGQNELCVGVPFHNRLTKEAEKALGVFIEFYPVTVAIETGETFWTLLKKVQTASNELLKKAVTGTGAAGSNAQFNTVMNFIHASFAEFAGKAVEPRWLHPGCSDREHHLRLHVEDFTGSGQIELRADFNCDVFDQSKRDAAVEHFCRLVEAMSEDWNQTITGVDILSESEKHRQVELFNQSEPAKTTPSVLERFHAAVEQWPDAQAVLCPGTELTYCQLQQQVSRVAGLISELQLAPGGRVAICVHRSHHAVIAMLAAWESGMVFVPVDPLWPRKRIETVLQDSATICALCTSDSRENLPDDARTIELDRIASMAKAPAKPQIQPDNTAYILYTSGSTGVPKGVEVSHGAIANYVNWAADFYCGQQQLSFPLFTPLTFDLTLTSILVPLVSGGRIVVYPPTADSSDIALLDVVDENLVDIVKLTPSHLSLLSGRKLGDTRIRQLILGGENLRWDLAQGVLASFPQGLKIHNEYGPTEATIGCIVHTMTADTEPCGPSVAIGRPIAGMQAYLLNDSMQLVPDGVAGELLIAGPGLAKGYFGQPELTDQAFMRCSAVSNSLLYSTGDLARFNRLGELEYLGRRDDQVKIRGARVEPGAVEAALLEYAPISKAAATVFLDDHANRTVEYCRRCGLASNFPDVEFDENLVCNQCRSFETYRDKAHAYFKSMDQLRSRLLERAERRTSGEYDCLALLSGGKDSTYMLARLADMDLRILAFTLDNGYISDQAKANIRRVVETLGVDHVFGSTPAMNPIFVDSLKRFSNVCQGCFKTIYTLSLNLAREKRIPFIVTGLSRGQFFETRLTPELFQDPCHSLEQIDQAVLDARKAYHRVDDAVLKHLDVAELQRDEIFDQVEFVDFYRYCDVDLDEMYEYLDQRLPWVRPSDTGRSTNCLINDVGIYVHRRTKGFHNYALPYSWDVRLGHKQREAALEELNDQIDVDQVHRILQEIGYDGELGDEDNSGRLVAYYVADRPLNAEEVTRHLQTSLPAFMMPSKLIQVDDIPLSENGKVDWSQLPDPAESSSLPAGAHVAPANETESSLADIWSEVLRINRIGTRDNFFELGGDSIQAIQIVARANRAGIKVTPAQLLNHSRSNDWPAPGIAAR